jgi:hypothetical protein
MRVVDIIAAAVAQVPEINEFLSSSKFILNYESDNNRVFPVAYLDRPIRVNLITTAQGTFLERYTVEILFAELQERITDSVQAQLIADTQIETMRFASEKFLTALQKDEQIEKIQSANYLDTTNFYDCGLNGVVLTLVFTLRVEFPYPCV